MEAKIMLQALWPVVQQFQNKNGSILVSGKIYVYYQGRTALATTYHDEDGKVVNSNPILLDNNGRANVFVNSIYSYTIVVCDYYGKELFSQDITLHDAISTVKDIVILGSDGSVLVNRSELPNGVQYDLSANKEIIATKKSVDDVKVDLDDLTVIVNNHTSQIGQIQEDVEAVENALANKKDKQNELNFNGSATKTIKKITQNVNGELNVEFEDIESVNGDNDKVAVDANAEPNYLENVLVSDSDIVSLVKLGNVLHVQVNTTSTADPKLATCDEAVINGATGNYGSYDLANGYDKLVWNDPSSYSWLNASVIQMKRLCTSQGTVTKCNLAICGSISLTSPPAFINCGIFNTDGKLLGSTGLRLFGSDFFSGSELISFDMSEVNTGDLNLKNNTYYIIQIITSGLQLASLSHANSYNYIYDYGLRMNLEGTTSKAAWSNINDLTARAAQIPWISFAASPSV